MIINGVISNISNIHDRVATLHHMLLIRLGSTVKCTQATYQDLQLLEIKSINDLANACPDELYTRLQRQVKWGHFFLLLGRCFAKHPLLETQPKAESAKPCCT